ncbi:ATP-binding cassette domain-containing protein [Agarivorans sp. TSD2052]|uniref:ATP-binding cassette domain-containing protein n=1 Tax=Agarivorans sp. TSD2052 TaxID=2937286 RepID=UPI00200DA537|nr:ATP-binding cassette domain-containing protein [Agarivorans sp. TSD2052]UPW18409.1 ATP-binding cassette domain-containing protein [Agarivorans sp. TSD2052]
MIIDDLRLVAGERQLSIKHWELAHGQHWAIFGHSGSGKSLLGAWLSGDLDAEQGRYSGRPERVGLVSLEQQQALLAQELAEDDSDFTDQVDVGHSVAELLSRKARNTQHMANVVQQCDLTSLMTRGFRLLSTGETRRLMLALALLDEPQLLILDEPFAGLDLTHQQQLLILLEQLAKRCQLVIITSRDEELPSVISHVAVLDEQGLSQQLTTEQWLTHPERQSLEQQASRQSSVIIDALRHHHQPDLPQVLFSIQQGKVTYAGVPIFSDLNWRIAPGQHWQIRGPNGCGKSTLLNLIFGDHPQCYSNQIEVLGYQRGTGESIWDIKQHIGMVSAGLHLQYRVNCSALEVVLSGLFDSIGVYQKPSELEIEKARLWLQLFGMGHLEKHYFKSLSYGQQRLLIIARALVKAPTLLLLDEPCQGLDFLHRRTVLNALELVAKHNLSHLVYVTHHLDDCLPSIQHYVDFIDGNVLLSQAL